MGRGWRGTPGQHGTPPKSFAHQKPEGYFKTAQKKKQKLTPPHPPHKSEKQHNI